MSANTLAVLINAAFQIIAAVRRLGMSSDEINDRLDAVDQTGEAITAEEVQEKLDDFQSVIDAGREHNALTPEDVRGLC